MYQHKIFDIEIEEGDKLYIANDICAEDEDQAIDMAIIMFGGLVDEYSKIVKVERRIIH
jgi:hypothetical protein